MKPEVSASDPVSCKPLGHVPIQLTFSVVRCCSESHLGIVITRESTVDEVLFALCFTDMSFASLR